MFEEMGPFYAQVLGIGLIWVTFHCVGMCGPIIASQTAGMGVHRAKSRAGRVARATAAVLSYQAGRALVYAALGASAGLVGVAAQQTIEGVARTAGLVVAVVILGVGLWKLLPLPTPGGGKIGSLSGRFTTWALRSVKGIMPSSGPLRMALFGVVLGFLPCVLMFWILGIAASTASAFHGAMIMVLLVVMTTPVLIFAALGASIPGVFRRLRSDYLIGGAMAVSGVWLLLIALAANGWIGHLHIPLQVADQELVIMLW